MTDYDYEDLGLVAGLEIHQQLDTDTKLFCQCPTDLREPEDAQRTFTRYLHPTKSELGEVDEAALEESMVDREFEYLAYDSTCLVEEDDEPPHRVDPEAMTVTMEIAQLLNAAVADQVHVMRKIVVDGSNTTGFQRTMRIAGEGAIETDSGTVRIEDLMLEEESAQRVAETDSGVRYSLDRLGIPLVEIGRRCGSTSRVTSRSRTGGTSSDGGRTTSDASRRLAATTSSGSGGRRSRTSSIRASPRGTTDSTGPAGR